MHLVSDSGDVLANLINLVRNGIPIGISKAYEFNLTATRIREIGPVLQMKIVIPVRTLNVDLCVIKPTGPGVGSIPTSNSTYNIPIDKGSSIAGVVSRGNNKNLISLFGKLNGASIPGRRKIIRRLLPSSLEFIVHFIIRSDIFVSFLNFSTCNFKILVVRRYNGERSILHSRLISTVS